jgi:hypothetical protein
LKRLVDVPAFIEGRYDTGFIELHRAVLLDALDGAAGVDERMAAAALIAALDQAQAGSGATRAAAPERAAGFSASAWREAHHRQRLGFRA